MTFVPRQTRMAPKKPARKQKAISRKPKAPPPGNHNPIRHGLVAATLPPDGKRP